MLVNCRCASKEVPTEQVMAPTAKGMSESHPAPSPSGKCLRDLWHRYDSKIENGSRASQKSGTKPATAQQPKAYPKAALRLAQVEDQCFRDLSNRYNSRKPDGQYSPGRKVQRASTNSSRALVANQGRPQGL